MKKQIDYITVEINGKAYDYPRFMPIPKLNERVSINDSIIGTVTDILHQVDINGVWMITIKTKTV